MSKSACRLPQILFYRGFLNNKIGPEQQNYQNVSQSAYRLPPIPFYRGLLKNIIGPGTSFPSFKAPLDLKNKIARTYRS